MRPAPQNQPMMRRGPQGGKRVCRSIFLVRPPLCAQLDPGTLRRIHALGRLLSRLPVVGSGRMAAKLSMPISIVGLLQNLQRRTPDRGLVVTGIKSKTYTSSIQRHNPRPCLVATPPSKTNRRKNGRRRWIPKDDGSRSSTPRPTADSLYSAQNYLVQEPVD